MNMAPFIAYRMTNKKASYGKNSYGRSKKPDAALIIMTIALVVLFAMILLLIISSVFAEIEVVSTTSMTVVELTKDIVPKYDEFFVTLSNGQTYEISRYTYSNLAIGDVVEVSQEIKHTFLGDINGLRIADEFIAD